MTNSKGLADADRPANMEADETRLPDQLSKLLHVPTNQKHLPKLGDLVGVPKWLKEANYLLDKGHAFFQLVHSRQVRVLAARQAPSPGGRELSED